MLMIQLARLGDLVQTIPAITALKETHTDWTVDLLCPAHLEDLGRMLPGFSLVLKWDGAAWNRRALQAAKELRPEYVAETDAELRAITKEPYDYAFVLNQHPRAILAGALLARDTIGTIVGGPLEGKLSPWASYVRAVAGERRWNRIHLADAFCGMCGISPPRQVAPLNVPLVPLPGDLDSIAKTEGPWIALLVGAGDQERLVPLSVWITLITRFLQVSPRGRVVLVGHIQEQERAQWIQDALPSSCLGRVWDTTGRLSMTQLAVALMRSQVVVGADTGPLHLAAAVGTRVIGWYFARARVHETGPYGPHHWVWQAEQVGDEKGQGIVPNQWPIDETIALLSGRVPGSMKDWSLWSSHRDRWGAYYLQVGHEFMAPPQREQVWQKLQLSPVI
ncbi:MAG: glycosyltransferase family 9 protein [Nitrospira sp.]|nr:glycosyltransferase family 9 protein [Nitrospira sp.]